MLFITLLLISLSAINGQIDLNSKCEIINSTSPCGLVLPYTSFYLNSSNSQEINQFYVETILGYKDILQECTNPILQLICLTLYPFCNPIPNTTPQINLPSYPCKSVCEPINDQCGTLISLAIDDFSCNQLDSNGNPEYPTTSTIYDLSPYGGLPNQEIQCNNGDGVKDLIIETGTCSEPLVYVEPSKREKQRYYFISEACALPCPFQAFSDTEMQGFRTAKIITYLFSFLASVYLFVVYAILPNKWTYRTETITSYSSGCIMIALAYYMEFADSSGLKDYLICSENDPGRYTFQSDAKCGFNAFFFHFGLLTSCIWWLNICYDFYLTIRIQRNDHYRIIRVVSWTIPIICTIAPFIGKKFGAGLGSTGCWIIAGNDTAWPYLCFYIPMFLLILLGCYFLIFSIKRIIETYHLVPNRKIIIFNIRMIIFMVWVVFAIVFGCYSNFFFDSKSDEFEARITKYFTCLFSGGEHCLSNGPFATLRLLNIIATSTVGFAGFVGFGFDDAPRLWSESTKVIFIAQLIKSSSLYNYMVLRLQAGNLTETTHTGNSTSSDNSSSMSPTSNSRKERRKKSTLLQPANNEISNITANIELDTIVSNQESSANNNNDNNNNNDES